MACERFVPIENSSVTVAAVMSIKFRTQTKRYHIWKHRLPRKLFSRLQQVSSIRIFFKGNNFLNIIFFLGKWQHKGKFFAYWRAIFWDETSFVAVVDSSEILTCFYTFTHVCIVLREAFYMHSCIRLNTRFASSNFTRVTPLEGHYFYIARLSIINFNSSCERHLTITTTLWHFPRFHRSHYWNHR